MEMDHGDVEDALAPKQRELDEALLQLRISREVEARMGRAAPTVSLLPAQRRLDRFRGDVGAAATREWIADARACLATHQGALRERASFLLQHLGGNARLEVTGRPDLQGNPEGILNIIEKTFMVQPMTYPSYRRSSTLLKRGTWTCYLACWSLLTCSTGS